MGRLALPLDRRGGGGWPVAPCSGDWYDSHVQAELFKLTYCAALEHFAVVPHEVVGSKVLVRR